MFYNVPNEWFFTALKLSEVPKKITEAIRTLCKQWATNLIIHGKSERFMSDLIRYLRGIFQGNSLSGLLFILAVNTLSFLLKSIKLNKRIKKWDPVVTATLTSPIYYFLTI